MLPSSRIKKLHFIGIGGAGMSGIAEILQRSGFEISGSDSGSGSVLEYLANTGIKIFKEHVAENVIGCDLIVYSSAVPQDNPEIVEGKKSNIPVMRRAEMLGELMRLKYTLAIAGTHGKTTTTSLVGHIWCEADKSPTIIVGGIVKNMGTGALHGEGNALIAEADEYDKSFLEMVPSMAILTNVEEDHLDCYKDLDDIKDAFVQFANKVPFYGQVIACVDDAGVRDVLGRIRKPVVTYGYSRQADYRVDSVESREDRTTVFVSHKGEKLGSFSISLSGKHNVQNSLAALAVAMEEGIEFELVSKALGCFSGVKRRFEQIAKFGKCDLYDDYAHHPSEVSATLEGMRSRYPESELIVVFQPHLYSRTSDQYKAFASSFMNCDQLILAPVFGAREKPIVGVNSELIRDEARVMGHANVSCVNSLDDVPSVIEKTINDEKKTVVITMGAGSVWKVLERVEKLLRNCFNG